MRGIRFRATATVAAVLALALLVGGLALTTVLRSRLTENLDATLESLAVDRVALLAEGADPASLTATSLSEATVWIGTPDGATLASGGRVRTDGPPAGVEPGILTVNAEITESYRDGTDFEIESLRVVVREATSPDLGELIVAVGSELEVVDQPVGDVRRLLLLGAPLLLLLVGGLTWVTADRALQPVESIRASAERIDDHRDGPEIEVPATGDEIERLAVTVNDMLARLADQDERQRRFVGDASHELKSPLANLRIDLETTDDFDTETQVRQIAQVDRLAAIVDDLLALARHDEGRPIRHSPVDLDDIVFDALEAAAPTHDRRIDIDRVTPVRVGGDAAQLRRAVRNLVDNATRHSAGRVAVSIEAAPDRAIVHVDDDGDGVALEQRELIFERFARADQARARDHGGTGLGLAIVDQVARRHGGSVSVSDSPLGGARFSLSLPAGQAGAGAETAG